MEEEKRSRQREISRKSIPGTSNSNDKALRNEPSCCVQERARRSERQGRTVRAGAAMAIRLEKSCKFF